MKLNKIDLIKAAGIIGTAMSIGSTILSSYSNKKEQEALIDKKVREALNSKLIETKSQN